MSRTQISHIFKTVILPLPEQKAEIDVQAWVDRLLLVSSHLNTPAFGALKRLTGLIGFARGGSPYRAFVDFCEANNVSIFKENELMSREELLMKIKIKRKLKLDWNLSFLLLPVCPHCRWS